MNKREEKARREGMSYALRVAKEKGIEALEEDLKLRGAVNLPIPVSKDAFNECIASIRNDTVDLFIVMLASTLHDEFGFGQKRVQRAIDRFNLKCECLADDYFTWNDIKENIQEELNLTLDAK